MNTLKLPTSEDGEALISSAQRNSFRRVHHLVKTFAFNRPMSVTYLKTALDVATQEGHSDIVKLLMVLSSANRE